MITITETLPLQKSENGVWYVGGTRVTLDSLVFNYEQGASAEDIVSAFPVLDLSDVHYAIAYYLDHRSEIEEYLREREHQQVKMQLESPFFERSKELRERILLREKAQGA